MLGTAEPGFRRAHDRDWSRRLVIAQDVSLVTVSWKAALNTQSVEFDAQLARATHGGARHAYRAPSVLHGDRVWPEILVAGASEQREGTAVD
jgi:hypothetical protein